jgi:tetratricopeptide (TPR) repeat protein
MIPKNPYITGYPVGDTHAFVGRDDVVREVRQVLRQPHNNAIVLFGQRRIGKTSVLRELTAKLPQENAYHVVLFDLLDKSNWPLKQVLQALANKISDVLEQEKWDLGNKPETTFHEHLTELLNKLPSEQSLVLLFDEFDVLDGSENEQPASLVFFPYLRQLLDIDRQRLNFVFVIGRKIADMATIAKSLFRTAPSKRVSLLGQEDTVQLIRLSETNQTLNWTNIDKIWQLTSGHPYLTQQFCSRVWEKIYEKNPNELPTVTLKEVNAVEQGNILESCENALDWLWNGLPPAEKVVASALAGAGAKAITEAQLKKILNNSGVRMMIQSLHNAPRILSQDWDLIEPTDGGYRFRVELLRRWIAEYHPLSQVQAELDSIEPVADDLFKVAQRFYANHQFDAALDRLNEAVTFNPNHLGANLLLADILLARNEPKEAYKRLEKLYTYKESAEIREKLIQALLALAPNLKKENEQLETYERILELETDQLEAKTQWQKIWERRGNRAFHKEDFKGALEAYKKAKLDDKIAQVTRRIEQRNRLKRSKRDKTERRKAFIKSFLDKYLKGTLEVVVLIVVLVGSYFLFQDLNPKKPIIILEVEKLGATFDNSQIYSLTGTVSDKPYSLDSVKIYPNSDNVVKQARLKYDIRTIDLVKNQGTVSYYSISRDLLQEGENASFSFDFLNDDRFTFIFQFEGVEKKKPEFECKVWAMDNVSVPCKVKEKGYLSIFRGLPWFVWGTLLGVFLILVIELVSFFKRQEPDDVYK